MPNTTQTEVKASLKAYQDALTKGNDFSSQPLQQSYTGFLAALGDLVSKTDRYYQQNENLEYPVIADQAELDDFVQSYRAVIETASDFENTLKAETGRLPELEQLRAESFALLLDPIRKLLGKDLTELLSAKALGLGTLPEIIERARTRTYDISGQDVAWAGAGSSIRMVVTLPGENGSVEGFFTESKSATYQNEYRQLVEESLRTAPALEPVIRGLNLQHLSVCPVKHMKTLYAQGKEKQLIDQDVHNHFYLTPKASNHLAAHHELIPDAIRFFEKAKKLQTLYSNLENEKLGKNERLDQRNAAMSAVANLLGLGELLAYSELVELKTGNRRLTGTFMHKAVGYDIAKPEFGRGFLAQNAVIEVDTPEVKRQLADLQALDYICGNIDRHKANMLYQFDESDPKHLRLIGVQGIDNDLSFFDGTGERSSLPAPEAMAAIPESTAAKIEGLSRDMLKTVLRNFALEEAQLDAAWARTEDLKRAIREGREFYRNRDAGVLEKGRLRIVKDDEWSGYPLERLKGGLNRNYFNGMENLDLPSVNACFDREAERQEEICCRKTEEHYRQSGEIAALNAAVKNCDRHVYGGSDQYNEMMEAMDTLMELRTGRGRESGGEDAKAQLRALTKALEKARAYLTYKNTELEKAQAESPRKGRALEARYNDPNSKDARRIKIAAQVQEALVRFFNDDANLMAERSALTKAARIGSDGIEQKKQELARRAANPVRGNVAPVPAACPVRSGSGSKQRGPAANGPKVIP